MEIDTEQAVTTFNASEDEVKATKASDLDQIRKALKVRTILIQMSLCKTEYIAIESYYGTVNTVIL